MNAYKIMSYIGIFFFLIGLGLIVYGFTFFLEKINLEKDGIIVKGTVIDINVKPPYRAPIVRFKTRDNRTITFLSRLDVNVRWFNYHVGQEVDVIYDRNNPNNCQVNGFWEKNVGQVFLWTLGLIVVFLGLFMRKRYLRKAKEHTQRMRNLGY